MTVDERLREQAQRRMGGDVDPAAPDFYQSDALPPQGMVRAGTQYITAMKVTNERNLRKVLARCEDEAALAGEEFYYSWKQGGNIIEGPSVRAALCAVRNFGNCVVVGRVDEFPLHWVFHGIFIDLETGYTLERPFKKAKTAPKTKSGKEVYEDERGMDVAFQIGASKAIRNVVLNAMPGWLMDSMVAKAKEGILAKYEKLGPEKVRTALLRRAEAIKLPIELIEKEFGKLSALDMRGLVQVAARIRAIEDGMESIEALFGTKNGGEEPAVVVEVQPRPAVEAPVAPQRQQKPEAKPKPQPNQPPPKTVSFAETLFKKIQVAKTVEELEKASHEVDIAFMEKRINETEADALVKNIAAVSQLL